MKHLSLYTIRLCRYDEYPKLIAFISSYWSDKHVFCLDRRIFEFQHSNGVNNDYNFVIAVHNATKEIHAVLGFISSYTYDEESKDDPGFISGAIWKVRDDVNNNEIKKLGLYVLYYLLKKYPNSAYTTIGLSDYSQQIYNSLHFDSGVMNHYYIASEQLNDYKIAKNPITKGKNFSDNAFLLKYVSKIPEELECVYFPYKNKRYYSNRYLNHPYYKYQLLSVCFKSEVLAVLVVRKVFYETCSCIRIVDVCGDLKRIDNIYGNFQKLLDAENAEYIDCYNCGIPKEQFEKMGFVEVEKDTIIPNYFEPFEQKNIELRYASYAATSVVMFKGDCDQDRPNLL